MAQIIWAQLPLSCMADGYSRYQFQYSTLPITALTSQVKTVVAKMELFPCQYWENDSYNQGNAYQPNHANSIHCKNRLVPKEVAPLLVRANARPRKASQTMLAAKTVAVNLTPACCTPDFQLTTKSITLRTVRRAKNTYDLLGTLATPRNSWQFHRKKSNIGSITAAFPQLCP